MKLETKIGRPPLPAVADTLNIAGICNAGASVPGESRRNINNEPRRDCVGKGEIVSKHFYICPRCTFKGWASGDAPTCRDCGVPLERRELVSAELERGEFGLVKWAKMLRGKI